MAATSGQITVTTAGSAVNGGNVPVNGYVFFTAGPANTDIVYIGNDGSGSVSSATGYPLRNGSASGNTVCLWVNNLNEWKFDAAVSGEKIAWVVAGMR